MYKIKLITVISFVFWSTILFASYTIGKGDVISISIYEDNSFNGDFRVNDDGTINIPVLGFVKVDGDTVETLEKKLAKMFIKKKIYVNPHINIYIKKYGSKKVLVLGMVKEPGIINITDNLTVLDVISRAGGIKDGLADRIVLIRKKNDYRKNVTDSISNKKYFSDLIGRKSSEVKVIDLHRLLDKGDLSLNYYVKNGDIIFVPEAGKIYILGEVKKSGVYKYKDNLTVLKAITESGGFTVRAAPSRTRIIRVIDGKETTINVDLKSILKNEQKDVPLRNGDIIVVPESFF